MKSILDPELQTASQWYTVLARGVLALVAVSLLLFVVGGVWLGLDLGAAKKDKQRKIDAYAIALALKVYKLEHADRQPRSLNDLRFDDWDYDINTKPFKFFPPGTHKDHLGRDVMAEAVYLRDKNQRLQIGWDGELRCESARTSSR